MSTSKATRIPVGRWLAAGVIALGMSALIAHAAEAKPNLEGTWKIAKPQSALQPVSGEALPLTAWGKERYEENKSAAAKGDYEFDLTQARCSSPGLPRIMLTPERFKIFDRPRIITMVFEWNRLFRQIDMQGKPPKELEWGTMMGSSAGHWDGDVLVVDSTHFSGKKLLDAALPNSEDLELTERFRLKDKNTLEDRVTIKDPKVFTKAWDAVITYKRQPDEVFPEDVCLERKAAGKPPLPK